ncbi:hypothetical protein [Actinocorallia sp. A-T 12471]|uniref:hypothetical protein n=1 Tax=Actinocorallia sp. A-T 12471 TaxID=3089813 RepID=UPI0029D0EEB6|nr:hypothetical protein [Actinocorallia sp. A-T 12471]MDX6740323.1 hypothetical protein [Actinocorallia sp. A-T 12471]
MPETPLVDRVLGRTGYVLAALFAVVAVAVLAWPLLPKGEAEPGVAAPSAPAGAGSPGPAPSDYFPDLSGNGTGSGKNTGSREGDGPCGTQRAYYKRAGDGVEVHVVFPGVGAVRAVVVPTNGEPSMQSYTTAGDPTPHVFDFPNVSGQAVKKVGLTVTTASGARDCELQRR